jgi:glucose-1-phosphate thymidylyltransferase
MKGIILAGGAGTRLHPLTKVTSKQLLPVYDRPMIYYPLETLINAGIKEILIISDPMNIDNFKKLLGDGKDFDISIVYKVQEKPEGLAQAFIIGKDFIGDDDVTMILGDNIFIGQDEALKEAVTSFKTGGKIFVKQVPDPQRFGIAEFDANNQVISIEEKPSLPKSNFAVTGLYVFDSSVIEKAKNIKPSARGELEITDVNNLYLADNQLDVVKYGGFWLDTGTFDTLLEAANKVAELRNK